MKRTQHLVLPDPYASRVTTTSSHPQLRDLLVFTPTTASEDNSVTCATYDSLASHSLYHDCRPEYTSLHFSPCCVTYGCGLVAAGGQNSEIALKSAQRGQAWCHQQAPYLESRETSTVATRQARAPISSIVNSLNISPAPNNPSQPRLLVSSNDECIKVFDIVGRVPDWRGARRRRERARRDGWSVTEDSWNFDSQEEDDVEMDDSGGKSESENESVEESPSFDEGGPCRLVPRREFDLHFRTPINHCSVSPDGTKMIAVGDTEEVFLFNVKINGEYELVDTLVGLNRDASFSTDWDQDSSCFVIGSQDGVVSIYDHRQLGSGELATSTIPRTVATLKTTQNGPAGAVRKVKFSPGGRGKLDGALLAFTEHRNRIHLVDARNFEHSQILEIPTALSHPATSESSRQLPGDLLRVMTGPQGEEAYELPLRIRPQPRTRRRASVRNSDWEMTPGSGPGEAAQALAGERTRVNDRRDDRSEFEILSGRAEAAVLRARELNRSQREHAGSSVRRDGSNQEDELVEDRDDAEENEDDEEGAEDDEEDEGEDESDSDIDDHAEPPISQAHVRPSTSVSYAAAAATPAIRVPPYSNLQNDTHRNIPYTTLSRYTHSAAQADSTTPNPVLSLFAAPLVAPGTTRSLTPVINEPSYPDPMFRNPRVYPFSTSTSYPVVLAGVGAGGSTTQTYRATSSNFPLYTSPLDLLGLDWDEFGERLLVATDQRVWEWDVDTRSRRSRGIFGFA
ncbi:uncharacterized protein JCM15063_004902 [Sporobolomyces koalae]|uniref:uncharacterized protein n=1 Tax=Sporobolomyces koalae TaxID=500713 RepID=UPI00317581EA